MLLLAHLNALPCDGYYKPKIPTAKTGEGAKAQSLASGVFESGVRVTVLNIFIVQDKKGHEDDAIKNTK